MQVRSVLVVGGGLIGRYVVSDCLKNGLSVTVVSRRPRDIPPGATTIAGDISQPAFVSRLSKIIPNVDAIVYTAYSISDDGDYDMRVNCQGLRDIVAAVRTERVVYLSSVGVYGTSPAGLSTLDETATMIGDTQYQQSKIDAVKFLRSVEGEYDSRILHLSIVWDTPCPRFDYYSNLLTEGYVANDNIEVGTYNLLHARDASAAVILCLSIPNRKTCEEYIVSSEAVLFKDFCAKFEESLGVRRRPKVHRSLAPLTRGPIRKILKFLHFRSPLTIPEPKASWLNNETVYSSRKIRHQLGWDPKFSLREMQSYPRKPQ